MDTSIRVRLLELPRAYAEAGSRLVEKTHQLTEGRRLTEAFKAAVEADLALRWRAEDKTNKSNKEIRDAEGGQALAENDGYQRALANVQALEWAVAADRQLLESLRFERDVLVAVANNDGKETAD